MARAAGLAGAGADRVPVHGLAVLACWNAGTLAGALAGGGLGDPRTLGMDAMFPAAFLALLGPQLRRPGAPRAAVTGALIAAALVTVTPAGHPDRRGGRRARPGRARGARRSGGRMSWTAILVLAAASYALKALGAVLVGDREIRPPVRAVLDLGGGPAARRAHPRPDVSTAGAFAIDARLPALGVAAILVWRRAPFLVVVLAAAATAALLRAV